ncbi:coiled-coil and C2 domain-containing protein 1-like isoform X2 [Planococcus citri]|uniref:coiled-coil and C2 domain-containing protein 1-like isoform X2 n=1 Tax=Planococcus citri TaxID=170843 RepID=UPI0031F7CAC0
MFGRKTSSAPSKPSADRPRKNLSQYGLLDIDNMSNIDDFGHMDDDDDDDDLEAELLALTKKNAPKPKVKAKPVVDPAELDRMVQESLRDIPSDDDVSSGEDDPSLLAELHELQSDGENEESSHPAPVQPVVTSSTKDILEERLKLYQAAEQNAKNAGDSTKARRMTRGITTLKDLLRRANSGATINVDDIPPVVSTGSSKPPPTPAETPEKPPEHSVPTPPSVSSVPPPIPPRSYPSSPVEDSNTRQVETRSSGSANNVIDILKEREMQYKKGAVFAKKNGDLQTALAYMKIVKGLEPLIKEVEAGAMVNLDSLPPALPDSLPSPATKSVSPPPSLKRQESEKQTSTSPSVISEEHQKSIDTPQPTVSSPNVIPQPKTVLEALEQRMKLFKDREETAKKENDSGKARRNARIVKQYEDAIKLHKAGKPIPADELPTPPGWPPIPSSDSKPSTSSIETPKSHDTPDKEPEKTPVRVPSAVATKGHSAAHVSRNEKQLEQILERQKAFKNAALKAKQDGDMVKAKEYLRVVMGIQPMIDASKSGIPIDLNSLPVLPSENISVDEPSGDVIQLSNCIPGSDLDVYHKLETDLTHQIELCSTTKEHFKAIGDIVNANRFDQLGLQCKKDLKFVRLANSSNLRVPKFHYESKSFSIVQCNTDLTDNDVEVSVVQGVNYNVPNPKEIDTYVKLQFPYPTETPQQYKSAVVYNTNNPAYNFITTFAIDRNSRPCQRIFKRQVLKCEIWSKGGFFRSDSLLGTASVKLAPLETQCTLHDAYDLMDGRRTVGGKVELKIRIRDPIARKQVEHVEEKWLIIDS